MINESTFDCKRTGICPNYISRFTRNPLLDKLISVALRPLCRYFFAIIRGPICGLARDGASLRQSKQNMHGSHGSVSGRCDICVGDIYFVWESALRLNIWNTADIWLSYIFFHFTISSHRIHAHFEYPLTNNISHLTLYFVT